MRLSWMKYLGILFFVLAMISCQTGRQAPGWVEEPPMEADYFIGRASVEKEPERDDHAGRAKKAALDQLTEDIVAASAGAISGTVLSNANVDRETYFGHLAAIVRERLEGYEQVDAYEDENEYWVFYRLSMEKYREQIRKQQDEAAMRSLEFFRESEQHLIEGDLAEALACGLKAGREISPFWGMGVPFPEEGADQYLDDRVREHLQFILQGMRLRALPDTIDMQTGEGFTLPVDIEVQYSGITTEIRPVAELPLEVDTRETSLEYRKPTPTDREGMARLEITGIELAGEKEIRILPHIKEMGGLSSEILSQPLFESLLIPHAPLKLRVSEAR